MTGSPLGVWATSGCPVCLAVWSPWPSGRHHRGPLTRVVPALRLPSHPLMSPASLVFSGMRALAATSETAPASHLPQRPAGFLPVQRFPLRRCRRHHIGGLGFLCPSQPRLGFRGPVSLAAVLLAHGGRMHPADPSPGRKWWLWLRGSCAGAHASLGLLGSGQARLPGMAFSATPLEGDRT